MEKIILDENLVISMYQSGKYNVSDLASFFNTSISPIKRILKENSIQIRRFFSTNVNDIIRTCNICEIEKPIEDYLFCGDGKTHRMSTCKKCNIVIRKEKALKTKEVLSIKEKKCSKCKIVQSVENFYTDLIVLDGYSCSCKSCDKIDNDNKKEYRHQKYKDLKNDKQSFSLHKRKQKEYRKKPENKERIRVRLNKYLKEKREIDINYKLQQRLRNSLYKSIKNGDGTKFESVVLLINCSINDLKIHLESLFLPGMTWENWGKGADKWNIDHIKPCCSFDFTNLQQQKECFHYSNLRPLWEVDNFKKMQTSDRFLSINKYK